MQNKPKVKIGKMNITTFITMAYENKHTWTLGENGKNKPKQTQTKPIIANKMQKQTQYKAKQSQFQKPICPQMGKNNYLSTALFQFASTGRRCYNYSIRCIHIVRNIQ